MSEQNQTGGNDAEMYQSGGDMLVDKSVTNYITHAEAEQKDLGIINEIFEFVISNLKDQPPQLDKNHILVTDKIKLNFKDEADQQRVIQYFKYAYTKISMIQTRIELEDTGRQNDMSGDIFERYNKLKDSKLDNILILEKLFSNYAIPKKNDDPQYTNLTRAFVLFFFDDCTIFEKTKAELC